MVNDATIASNGDTFSFSSESDRTMFGEKSEVIRSAGKCIFLCIRDCGDRRRQ